MFFNYSTRIIKQNIIHCITKCKSMSLMKLTLNIFLPVVQVCGMTNKLFLPVVQVCGMTNKLFIPVVQACGMTNIKLFYLMYKLVEWQINCFYLLYKLVEWQINCFYLLYKLVEWQINCRQEYSDLHYPCDASYGLVKGVDLLCGMLGFLIPWLDQVNPCLK